MSVKKIFTWIYLLCKHILKMPVIFILLLIIPAVTLTFRLLPGSASQTGIYAGIYFESNDDPATIQLKTMLLSSVESSFSFVEYADRDVLENDVLSGKLECAYIFTDKFSKALSGGKYKNSMEVIKSPSTIMLSAINEIVFAAIVRMSGYTVLDDYIHTDYVDDATVPQLEEYMYEAYEAYCTGGETFHLDIRTLNNISLNDESNQSAAVTFPLRGILSILIMLAALSGSITWLADKENGIFATRPDSFRVISCILYPMLPAILFTLCTEAALFLSRNAYPPAAELAYSLRYIALVTVFSCVCCLLKKSRRVISLVPVLVLGSLIFCPVFINIENFFPAFRFIGRLFIPRYFL